jgi:dTDP-4-amino-4,6-dideoxygalactose transaminase
MPNSRIGDQCSSLIDCGRPHDIEGKNFTMGANYRLTEFQAVLGVIGLERFPAQAKQRESMTSYMDEALSEVPGVRILKRDPRHTTRSFYQYIFAIDPHVFKVKHDMVCYALEREGIPCEVGYAAMHHYELFQPNLSRLAVPSAFPERFDFPNMSFPVAERACEEEAVWLDESIFRADENGVNDVIRALYKILDNSNELIQGVKLLQEN